MSYYPPKARTFHLRNDASNITGYKRLVMLPQVPGTEATLTGASNSSAETLIGEWSSDVLDCTSIPAGVWRMNLYALVDNAADTTTIKAYFFSRNQAGTETALFNYSTAEINNTSVALITTASSSQAAFTVATTDRLIVKLYAVSTSGTNKTITLYFQGATNYSHILIPDDIPVPLGDMAKGVYDPDGDGIISGNVSSLTANVYTVENQSPQTGQYLQRDGAWRDPLIIGAGTVTVGDISTITDDTKYNAWPCITRMITGDLLLVYTKGDSHHADNTGYAVGKISSDEGATWGTEFTIYDHASLWASAIGASMTSTGRIFVTLWRDSYPTSGTGESGVVYSDDNGVTWSAWITLTNGFTQESFGAGRVIELTNGDLLVTIEGTNTGTSAINRSCHTVLSTDHGLTWGGEVTVRNYVTDTRPYYESQLVYLDNDNILCVHRCSALTGTHYTSLSTDGGLTWGTPASAFDGYGAPHTIQSSTRSLFAVTRRNSNASVILYTSIDRGANWSALTVLDATMNEMEYGAPIELLDGRILVVYGSQPTSSSTNSDIKQVYITEATNSLATTAAIAVSDTSTIDLTLSAGTLSGAVIPGGIKLDDLATPDNNTDLNATTGRHGLLLALGGGTTNFLRADGSWAEPPGSSGGGGGHLHGVYRVVAITSVTTYDLPDLAEYFEFVSDNGTIVDPTIYSLSADHSQLVFDSAPTAGNIIQANYVMESV